VRRDLAGRQSLCRQGQDDLIDTGQPALTLLDDLRLERGIRIPRHVDVNRPDLGEHRLGPHPVTGVAAAPPGPVMPVITQMLGHLGIQRGLQHVLRQLIQ
jgi:hypothetical protein